MLDRTGRDWVIAMFEVPFDDSGTDPQSEIAIAACYVSTKRGWDTFVKEWDRVAHEEGFPVFHMAEFVAPNSHGHKPWCDWDNATKDRIYQKLARIINENKRIGIGVAVPKSAYDTVPVRIRQHYGMEHYTFAVRMCLMQITVWREESSISLPMQYVFDWETPGTLKHEEISNTMGNIDEKLKPMFGMDGGGYSFQHRQNYKPLQAADILAWQMNSHMRKIYPLGRDSLDVVHPGFAILRQDQEMNLGFFTEANIKDWVEKIEAYEIIRHIGV
jgi:hypothetical protein